MRGYFGIGIYGCKTEINIGTLWRSANCFGASFIFTVGRRYYRQHSDTLNTPLHVPLFEYSSLEEFEKNKPYGCLTVCIELNDRARDLSRFIHPIRVAYILGAEDHGLPENYMKGKQIIQINKTSHCLNVATTGSIVLYDRISKINKL